MFDFSNTKRRIASVAGAALLSATCVFTAIAPARAAEVAPAKPYSPIVVEIAMHSITRS